MARGSVSLERPIVVGIVNITPDSFSDEGRFFAPEAAVDRATELLDSGADMLDLGGESTRPGRPMPVPADEEWRRVEPVLTALAGRHPTVPISVDTVKGEVARRALEAGAWAINDVSGLRLDPSIADACAAHGAGVILMHSRGSTSTMATYDHATYHDLLGEVRDELEESVAVAEARGVPRPAIVLDPGLGFAKHPDQNYRLLHRLPTLAALGLPLMIGPSRKRFLGRVSGGPPPGRDAATAVVCAMAYLLGAALFRVHAARPTAEALALAHAIRTA